jgi:hypothetical protein
MGSVIGLMFLLIVLGVLWWAIHTKLWPLISPYVEEPFRTGLYILGIFLLVFIVLYLIAAILASVGIHVAIPGFGGLLR